MRKSLRLAAWFAGSTCLAIAAAEAQSFLGVGPVRSFVLPGEPHGEPQPAPASAIVPPQPAPVEELRPPQDGLRRLPVTLKGFRFTGEWGEHEWPVHLTAPQASGPARFRLAMLSAISVMPEGSQIVVSVNDTVVGRTRTAAPDAAAIREFDIPPGLLKTGFNAIRIRAEQRHRVDCSPAAAYELWTTLDPAKTGLLLEAASSRQGFNSPADIASALPQADGTAAIRILLAGKLTPEMAGRAVKAAQIAALAGRSLQPVVAFTASGAEMTGLDIAIGTAEDLRARFELNGLGAVSGPRFGFLQARAEHAPTFVVTGKDAAEIDMALAGWNAERQGAAPTGSPAGLRAAALASGHAASGAPERIALRQTGFASTEFSGRLLRFGLNVAMPMDFLPADYDRMELALSGSHGAGLSRDAQITVEVNGRNAATRALSTGAARALHRDQIFLPLGLMRPGLNRIDIVATVPTAADATCVPSASADPGRITLLDRSELVLPRLARIGRSPELALTAAGGFPFAREGASPILYVPNPDRQTMAAAATIAARLAVAAGRPIDFRFTMTAPAPDAGAVLMVSPAPTLDPAAMRAAGLDPERVRHTWQGLSFRAADESAADDIETGSEGRRCALPQPGPRIAAGGVLATPAGFGGGSDLGLRKSLSALSFWNEPAPAGAVSEEEAVSASAVMLVAQDFPTPSAENPWTVVTAPTAAMLKAGVDCLTHPQSWSGLGGRLAALRADETTVFVPAGDGQRYVATQGFGLANARLVAAAWLSLNPLAYIGLALALVLCLAASTLWVVLNTGRKQES